jgi:hypothetical protein
MVDKLLEGVHSDNLRGSFDRFTIYSYLTFKSLMITVFDSPVAV